MKLALGAAQIIAIGVLTTGCSTILANQGRAQLVEDCAEKGEGMRFLPGDTSRSDNPLFSSATVTGLCVGPDHPEYENAIAPEE